MLPRAIALLLTDCYRIIEGACSRGGPTASSSMIYALEESADTDARK